MNAKDHFENDRQNIRARHASLIKTLTKDSFLVLEQFADLAPVITPSLHQTQNELDGVVLNVDDKWSRWQLTWDIENVDFYNKNSKRIKSWGDAFIDSSSGAKQVLANEMPINRIICPNRCLQQAIVPLMGKSEILGAISITRAFSNVLIQYKDATNSDIGILVKKQNNPQAWNSVQVGWQYQLKGMTSPEKNLKAFEYITRHYAMEVFLNEGKRVDFNKTIYEIQALPVQQKENGQEPPFFLFFDDITADIHYLNAYLKRIWLYSLIGMLIILCLIFISLHLFFRRITSLSKALPLLSQKQFGEFRKQIPIIDKSAFGQDEIDKLTHTALVLVDQLESLEKNMRRHTFDLLEKSQELAKERDFVRQLIDLAPIIIIIQKLNGIILSINLAGIAELDADTHTIVGKVFDNFIPEKDLEHLNKLNRLRSSELSNPLQQDGQLITETGKLRDISWVHKLLPLKEYGNEVVMLTIGIDISERKLIEARNIRMAYYDYLTGLGNRRKFHEEFAQQLATAERYHYQLALLYMDLDRFKEINDTSGHEAGDNFLKMVANALKGTIRTTDLLCRLGGDEFTMLMQFADSEGVENIANKVNLILKEQVFECGGKVFTPSASIGIAVFPLHGKTVNELMANADLAMYRAKELGRGQYHIFNTNYDYRSKSNQMVHWRNVLEDAIEHDKLNLVYQPILNIRTGEISYFECLVRLQLDDGQIIMPSEFVFRAEELGLISKIDKIVLEKAIQQHIEFNHQGKNYKLSINVSRRSFENPAIFEEFAYLLDNPQVDKKRIIFEITDTSAVSNYQTTNLLIHRIKELGCVLSLNDFGIEYPSLQYLKSAPVDYVKIDGSLIRQIDKNSEDKAFVKALTEVAQAFGKKTVAEYVENESILEILREFGIDYAQGYHIGRPASLD